MINVRSIARSVAVGAVTAALFTSATAAQQMLGWADAYDSKTATRCTVQRTGVDGASVFITAPEFGVVELVVSSETWGGTVGEEYFLQVKLNKLSIADSWPIGGAPYGIRVKWAGIAEALRQGGELQITGGDKTLTIDMNGAGDVVNAVSACAEVSGDYSEPDFAEEPELPSPAPLDPNLAAEFGGIINAPMASFQCLFGAKEMYGIADITGGKDRSTPYRIDVIQDGTLRIEGREVKATLPMYNDRVPTLLDGVAADVRELQAALTAGNSQLPATFGDSAKQFSEFMDMFSGMSGDVILGDRQRFLIIFIETGSIGFADVMPTGEVTNTTHPQCYRLN